MPGTVIRNDEQLREIIKPPPGTVTAKIGSGPLAASPSEFLMAARLGVLCTSGPDGLLQTRAVGGPAGFVTQSAADRSLVIPLDPASEHGWGEAGASVGFVGMLLIVPGVKYTLRVNGVGVIGIDGQSLVVTPKQNYAHCAKAFIRSALWNANTATAELAQAEVSSEPGSELNDVAVEFIESSPFAALGTSLDGTDADVSPRGDPAGFVAVVDRDRLFIPERPGNRIADSLRNIIANPMASLLFMIPGDPRVLEVAGEAEVTTDEELCAAAEVNAKIPKLGVVINVKRVALDHEPALAASGIWDPATYAQESNLPTIGALVADPKGTRSVAKRALSGVTDKAVELDYKRNLY